MEQILKTNISLPDWSFKSIDSDAFRKLEKSIIKNGQLKSIVVRSLGDGKYEAVDGKIVFSILKLLEVDYIWCQVVKMDRLESQLLYMQLNYNFDTDFIELAKTVKKLAKNYSTIEISRLVDLTVKEINDLITLNDFDFERYKPIAQNDQANFF